MARARMVADFGSRPVDVRVSRGDAWESIRLGLLARQLERREAEVAQVELHPQVRAFGWTEWERAPKPAA